MYCLLVLMEYELITQFLHNNSRLEVAKTTFKHLFSASAMDGLSAVSYLEYKIKSHPIKINMWFLTFC